MADTLESRPTRRALLTRLAGGVLVSAGAACGLSPQRDRPNEPHVTLPLSDVPDGDRRTIRIEDQPIEVRRRGTTVEARLLLCTHMGCLVSWHQAEQRYVCPCHSSVFDADGNVVQGTAARPLDKAPVFVDGQAITVYRVNRPKPASTTTGLAQCGPPPDRA